MANQSEMSDDNPVWTAIRVRLEEKRKETFEALRNYPGQIAGCDTHYQYLAEQRVRISGELRQLDVLRRENNRDGIDEFLRDSTFFDDALALSIRAEFQS
jgi:hypothetical protein